MRLVLAGLTLLALAAAAVYFLVLPKLHPDQIARAFADRLAEEGIVTEQVGAVTVASWLPQPTVSLDNVVLSGTDGEFRAVIDRIDMALDLQSIVEPEPVVASLRLVRPQLEAPAAADAGWLTLANLRALPEFQVADGSLELATAPDQEVLAFSSIAVTGLPEATQSNLELTLDYRDQPFVLALEIGTGDSGGLFPFAAVISGETGELGEVRGLASADFDRFQLDAAINALSSEILNEFGAIGTTMAEIGDISIEARLEREDAALSIQDLEARVGDGRIIGVVDVRTGDDARIDAELQLSRLAIDERWFDAALELQQLVGFENGYEGSLQISGNALRLGSKTVRRLDLDAMIEPGAGLRISSLDLAATDGTTLQLAGLVSPQDDAFGLRGSLSASGPSLREILQEFELPAGPASAPMLQSFELQSYVDIAPGRWRFQGASLRVDATEINGSLAVVRNGGLTVALSAAVDRLAPDEYLAGNISWDGLWEAWFATAQTFREVDIAAELTVDLMSIGQLRARDVVLQGSLEDGQLTLGELSASSVADARAQLVGTADLHTDNYDFAIEASAEDPALLLRSLGLSIPVTLSDLGPLRLDSTARRSATGDDIELVLTGPELDVEIAGTVGSWQTLDSHRLRLTGILQNARNLAAALGIAELAETLPAVPLSLEGVSEDLLGVHNIAFETMMAEASMAIELEIEDRNASPQVEGFVVAEAFPVDVFAYLRERLAARASSWLGLGNWGLGRWTNSRLRVPPPLPARLGLLARAESFRSETGDILPGGQLRLEINDRSIALQEIAVPLQNGTASGALRLVQNDGSITLESQLRLTDVPPGLLLDLDQAALDWPDGLDVTLELESHGRSLGALADAASGTGRLQFDGQSREITVDQGIAATQAPLDLRFDLYAWLLDGTLERPDGTRLRLFGSPADLVIDIIQPAGEAVPDG